MLAGLKYMPKKCMRNKKENFINIDLIHYLLCDAVTYFMVFEGKIYRAGTEKRLNVILSLNDTLP